MWEREKEKERIQYKEHMLKHSWNVLHYGSSVTSSIGKINTEIECTCNRWFTVVALIRWIFTNKYLTLNNYSVKSCDTPSYGCETTGVDGWHKDDATIMLSIQWTYFFFLYSYVVQFEFR